MVGLRTLLGLVFAASFAVSPAWAEFAPVVPAGSQLDEAPPRGTWLPGGRSYLGLNLGRSHAANTCMSTALLCDETSRPLQLYTGTMVGSFWGVELGYLNLGRIALAQGSARAQGLNLSLVGKTQLLPSLNVFGKVGTVYGRSDTSAMGASGASFPSEQGFGLSMGAGVSYDFTPRLSATLEWDRNDFRFSNVGREPVRSTNLGLQFRY